MDTLTMKRLKWLTALESGEYDQTHGALFHKDKQQGTVGYCCIGVARNTIDPGYFYSVKLNIDYSNYDVLMVNEEVDYEIVREELELPTALTDYLIGMNDGASVYKQREGDFSDGRVAGNKRDFKFIARFLRKVWGLTDVEATLA